MPSLSDYELAKNMAQVEDSLNSYNSVAAPGANAVITTISPTARGTYEALITLKITAGANATVTSDNYDLRVGGVSKFRILHTLLLANGSQVFGQFSTRIRVPAGTAVTVNCITAEVAASTISANLILKRVGDYFA